MTADEVRVRVRGMPGAVVGRACCAGFGGSPVRCELRVSLTALEVSLTVSVVCLAFRVGDEC